MNSEHDEVRRWLETVFNKSRIPDYQLTPEGLEALNMIRKMSQEAEFREAQIREHKLREVREMEAETKRIKKFVQRTGNYKNGFEIRNGVYSVLCYCT